MAFLQRAANYLLKPTLITRHATAIDGPRRHVGGEPGAKVMQEGHGPSTNENIMSIVQQISQLKFHEVALLTDALKKELKIPDVQTVAAGPATTAEAEAKTETKAAYTVKLVKFDDTKKVALIKEIKKLVQGINLVEAKRFVEECPKVIGSNMSKDEAEALQKQLEAAGGVVKLS